MCPPPRWCVVSCACALLLGGVSSVTHPCRRRIIKRNTWVHSCLPLFPRMTAEAGTITLARAVQQRTRTSMSSTMCMPSRRLWRISGHVVGHTWVSGSSWLCMVVIHGLVVILCMFAWSLCMVLYPQAYSSRNYPLEGAGQDDQVAEDFVSHCTYS